MTPLERAFELAATGKYQYIDDIVRKAAARLTGKSLARAARAHWLITYPPATASPTRPPESVPQPRHRHRPPSE